MSEKRNREYPYKSLGSWLKSLRQKHQQTLAEVSGAVEIDIDLLTEIERGARRPGEDILMLLISYFAIKEDDAVRIWEMAGYSKPEDRSFSRSDDQVQPVLVMPMDARIVYTDMVNASGNKYGLTLNFLQSEGLSGQPLVVSRVGMSREQAQNLLDILEKALKPKQQKLLPGPEPTDDKSKSD